MARPGFVNRDDLLRWADTVTARTEFPRLIRRLAWETSPDAVQLGFPAGSGTSSGDWDGSVRASAGNAFVPVGLSLWELSTEKNIARKADGDYGKRTSTPDGTPTTDAVYVAAILRPWTDRQAWATGKRGDGRWKDVRAYGVDDIEEWLETAPVTHSWISELLGLAPHGYQATESWWRIWTQATNPALPSGVVLADRDEAVAAWESRLAGTPGITTIRGGSAEEILAFIAAVLDRQANAGNSRWQSRAAFIDQVTSWRALAERPGPLILVPTSADVAAEAAQGTSHHIVIPVLGTTSADIVLQPIDARIATAVLRGEGLGDAAAEDAGRLARRSLLSMRRSLAIKPELHTPAWASSPPRSLRGMLLAGGWNEDHNADRAAVTELTGDDYDALRETLAELTGASDPFITRIGPAWTLVSPQDAWIQLREKIRGDDLDRLEPVLRRVLLEPDPALDLNPDDRWYAATVGKSPAHSSDLRRGLVVTLALLGIHGEVINTGHGGTGTQWTASIVRGLLRDANADTAGVLWNSLASVLPQLAEAAPDAFLDGVRDATAGSAPVIAAMFTDSEPVGVTTERSRHYHLLWALERLAWSQEHFGRVTGLLARLAEIDPGGRMRNRPFNSLVTIFCLPHPETSVPTPRRMTVIDNLRQRYPDIAWQLMGALLPSQFALHDPTPDPEFRDWKPQEPATVTTAEWAESVATLVGWLIQDAGDDAHRWQQLLQALPYLPASDRERIRDALATRVGAGTLSDDGRDGLWETLRELIARHRSHPGMQGAFPADELDALQDVEEALAPADPVQRYEWLFARQLPELGDNRRFSDPAYDTALRDRRDAAVAEVEKHGLDAVRRLASDAVDARIVGACLASATGDKYRTDLVTMIPAATPADEGLAEGWLARRFQDEGWTWLDGLLAEQLTPEQAAVALLASRDYPKAWQVADSRGTPVAEAFWRYFSISGLGHGFSHATEAAGRLAEAGRVSAALKLAVIYLDDLGSQATDFLIGLLSQFTGKYLSDPDIGLVNEYDFRSVFQYMSQHADPQRSAELGRLEWEFLGVLGSEPPIGRLYEVLAADPDLFVKVMEVAWRASDDEGDENDEHDDDTAPEEPLTAEQLQRAENAYMLLTSFDRLPGTDRDGHVDPTTLKQWIAQVLELAAASGRRAIAEALVGQILASAPADADGTWPCRPVRELLEELQNERVERNLAVRLYNQRGLTMRDPEEGGKQEHALADEYRTQASTFSDSWPQTAVVLRSLASMYDTDAREEETRAERFRQGQRK